MTELLFGKLFLASAAGSGGLLKPLQDWWQAWNFRGYGNSTQAEHSDWLFYWIFLISAFFFVLLMALMVYFTFVYRRRPGVAPARSRSHNTFLELSWSVIPTILLVWMFFEGFWGYANVVVPPGNAPEVVMQGRMWSWTATYPNGAQSPETTRIGAVDVPIFVMPEKQPIQLRMHSSDVIHSFWIPDFRVKFDVFPNRYTTMWFEAKGIDRAKGAPLKRKIFNEQGSFLREEPWLDSDGQPYYYEDHWVFCAEYCGAMHSEMLAVIRVVPQEAFAQFMIDWAEPRGTLEEQGAVFYRTKGCNACHSVDGSRMVGPTWKDLYGYERTFTNADPVIADADYIRESMLSPGAKVVQGFPNTMPTQQGQITEHQINALIAYMRTLSNKGAAAPAAAPGEGRQDVPPEGVHPAADPSEQPQVPPEAQKPPQ